jgi:virulence-associated protein VapD
MGYIKTNYIKCISSKLFYPHELQESGVISILQIKSCDNLANLFTKSLPLATFNKCVKDISMHRFKDLQDSGGDFL